MEHDTTPMPDVGHSPLPAFLRLQRIRAVVECLRDALGCDRDYSPHFARRADVCGLISDELDAVTREIEEGTL